jgi:hypothetical protein
LWVGVSWTASRAIAPAPSEARAEEQHVYFERKLVFVEAPGPAEWEGIQGALRGGRMGPDFEAALSAVVRSALREAAEEDDSNRD